ncbi:unnamed protein product [Clonostachys solani]|uniref:Uncharacterized protein n=1 Tax=Clonostachys solani TaxID=160281 RepID=A0A9P0EF59_9HYPO|nr:unnamed protein product [Clonostachys solani]
MSAPASSQPFGPVPPPPPPPDERVKSRLPRRSGRQPLGTDDGAAAAVTPQVPIELIHQALSVICLWHPAQPAQGLAWTENAYLALTGIAASQLELHHTGDTEKANETLTEFLTNLDMDCDTDNYETWRHVVTGLWRSENVAARNGHSSHSVQLLLNSTPLNTPPRDCMGAVCALGLLQSVLPLTPETRREHPLNPLFLLKYKYPEVTFEEIEQAFDTEIDEQAFFAWAQRVNAIMECMGPLTTQPVFVDPAGGIAHSGVTYAEYLKDYASAICNLGESQFESFSLNDAIRDVADRFTAAKVGDPPPGTPEDCLPRRTIEEEDLIHSLHCEIVNLVFGRLSDANLAAKNARFRAIVQIAGQKAGTIMSPKQHFFVLIPMAGDKGCHVKIGGEEVPWNPGTGYLLDSDVPICTDSLIGYIAIFAYKY